MKPDYLQLQVPDVAILFEHGQDISPNEIYRLLSFPRESLIADCRALIQHAYQYQTTYQNAFIAENIEARHLGFVYHAIQILAELEDEQALRAVASFLVQDWESYSFWFGNLRPFWSEEVLYLLGKNQLSVLSEAMLAAKGHLFARASSVMSLSRAAWINPLRKKEVEGLFLFALDELETWGEALHGTERMEELGFLQAITPVIVEEAHKLGMEGILLRALELSEMPSGIGMEAEKIKAKLQLIPEDQTLGRGKIPNILDRYATVAVGFDKILQENPVPKTPFSGKNSPKNKEPLRKGPKVGRNDPCPCGSGKKYKKCHGN